VNGSQKSVTGSNEVAMLKKSLLLMLLSCFCLPVFAVDTAEEYEIKAAFLVNLLSFVKWPDSLLKNADASFNLCIIGTDPFGERLDIAVEKRAQTELPLQAMRLTDLANINKCAAVFISKSEHSRTRDIIVKLDNQPVLTVSDMDNFVKYGGMVQFFNRANKVRLMLAPSHFSRVGLKPDAHLMRVAVLVDKNHNQP
jgi:hypothetical protein